MDMLGDKIIGNKTTGIIEPFNLVSDVLFIDIYTAKSNYRVPKYHTLTAEYQSTFLTLDQCEIAFTPYGFVLLDAVNLVNLRNISYVKEGFRKKLTVYFANGKTASVSDRNRKFVEHLIKD